MVFNRLTAKENSPTDLYGCNSESISSNLKITLRPKSIKKNILNMHNTTEMLRNLSQIFTIHGKGALQNNVHVNNRN